MKINDKTKWWLLTTFLCALVLFFASCTTDNQYKDCVDKTDLFIDLTERQYKSTENFIRCLKRQDMDSVRYYSTEQSIYLKLQTELTK